MVCPSSAVVLAWKPVLPKRTCCPFLHGKSRLGTSEENPRVVEALKRLLRRLNCRFRNFKKSFFCLKAWSELHDLGVWYAFDFYDCFGVHVTVRYGFFYAAFAYEVHYV